MSFRVHIEENFMMQAYRIWLVEKIGDSQTLWTHDHRFVRRESSAAMTVPDPDDYFADVPADAAHAVLGALSRQLGAVEHPLQLRRDFEHERGRVDKLMDWMMKVQ